MVLKIKSGTRGRPLEIDADDLLKQYMQQLPKAKIRLQKIREATSGERSEEILGSETALPKGIRSSIDVLEAIQQGEKINYETARELKANLETVKQLASKQERVYGRALASSLLRQYEQEIQEQSQYASPLVKQTYKGMLERAKRLTPKQQQQFFTGRGYQSVKTNYKEYQKLIKWAEKDIATKYGQEVKLTGEEAMAYLLEIKQIEAVNKL